MRQSKCLFQSIAFRFVGLLTVAALTLESNAAYAWDVLHPINVPMLSSNVALSNACNHLLIKGLKLNPADPFHFDFMMENTGEAISDDNLHQESYKLIKYFLASLAVPGEQMWVNLSPSDRNRMVTETFGRTDMGKDLLMQDYLLKQMSTQTTNPESEIGKNFWDELYGKVYDRFGHVDIPIESFQRVWIVPQKADVVIGDQSVFIEGARLNVMLESDYRKAFAQKGEVASVETSELNEIYTTVMKDVVIPFLQQEVNEGETFANLRQIYHALILATWFKKYLKQNIFNRMYSDRSQLNGIALENSDGWKEELFQQYMSNFNSGIYNVIKEDYDPNRQEIVARSYFSGGVDYAQLVQKQSIMNIVNNRLPIMNGFNKLFQVNVNIVGDDSSMLMAPMKKFLMGALMTMMILVSAQSFASNGVLHRGDQISSANVTTMKILKSSVTLDDVKALNGTRNPITGKTYNIDVKHMESQWGKIFESENYGWMQEAVTVAFQHKHHLPEDGDLGAETLEALGKQSVSTQKDISGGTTQVTPSATKNLEKAQAGSGGGTSQVAANKGYADSLFQDAIAKIDQQKNSDVQPIVVGQNQTTAENYSSKSAATIEEGLKIVAQSENSGQAAVGNLSENGTRDYWKWFSAFLVSGLTAFAGVKIYKNRRSKFKRSLSSDANIQTSSLATNGGRFSNLDTPVLNIKEVTPFQFESIFPSGKNVNGDADGQGTRLSPDAIEGDVQRRMDVERLDHLGTPTLAVKEIGIFQFENATLAETTMTPGYVSTRASSQLLLWMDALTQAGVALSGIYLGFNPYQFVLAMVSAAFLNRIFFTAKLWAHERFHLLDALRRGIADVDTPENRRANLTANDWLQLLKPFSRLQKNLEPKIELTSVDSVMQKQLRLLGFKFSLAESVVTAGSALAAFMMFPGLATLLLLIPLFTSALTTLIESYQTDVLNKSCEGALGCGNYGLIERKLFVVSDSVFKKIPNGDVIFKILLDQGLIKPFEDHFVLPFRFKDMEGQVKESFPQQASEILKVLRNSPQPSGFRVIFPRWAQDAAEAMVKQLATRGGQSIGVMSFLDNGSSLKLVLAKHLKGKRWSATLSGGALKKLRRQMRVAMIKAMVNIPTNVIPQWFKVNQTEEGLELRYKIMGLTGHVRFSTFSAVTQEGSHPHTFTEKRRSWVPVEKGNSKTLILDKSNAIITNTHNGDNDSIEMFGEDLGFVGMKSFFARLMGFERYYLAPTQKGPDAPTEKELNQDYMDYHATYRSNLPGVNPPFVRKTDKYPYEYFMRSKSGISQQISHGDSPMIALQMGFLLTQGSWKASARLAHTLTMNDSLAQAETNMLEVGEWDDIGIFFDGIFETLMKQSGASAYFADLFDPAVKFTSQDGLKEQLMNAIENSPSSKATNLMKGWNQDRMDRFMDVMIEAFFRYDRYRAVKEFQKMADGAYGLVVRTNIGGDNGVTMLSMGQPLTYGLNQEGSIVALASDHTALLTDFGPHGSLESVILLKPGRRGQVADLYFSPTGKLETVLYDSTENRELTRDEIMRQSYDFFPESRYFEPLVSYEDPKKSMVEQDLDQTPEALKKLEKNWEDENSFNSRTANVFSEQLLTKVAESYVKDNSSAYQSLSTLIRREIQDRLQAAVGLNSFIDADTYNLVVKQLTERISNETVFRDYALFRADGFIHAWAERLAKAYGGSIDFEKQLLRQVDGLNRTIESLIPVMIKDTMDVLSQGLDAVSPPSNGTTVSDDKTAQQFMNHVIEMLNMKRKPFKPFAKNTLDVVVSGYSDSHLIDQGFVENLKKIFPGLKIQAIEANELLRNQDMVGSDTIVILTSKSGGQTFATGSLVSVLERITPGHVFGSVARPDSLMSVMLGQELLKDSEPIDRMFVTGNTYPSESITAGESLMYFQQLKITEYLADHMRHSVSALKPFGMKWTSEVVDYFKQQNADLVHQTEILSGITVNKEVFNSPSHEAIVSISNRLSRKVWEAVATLVIGTAVYTVYSVALAPLGAPTVGTLVVWTLSLAGSYVNPFIVGGLHALLYISLGWLLTIAYRKYYGLPLWSRLGVQPTVIVERSYFALMHELFLSKLGSLSFPWMSMDVNSGDGSSEVPAKFAHRVKRGGVIVSALPFYESRAAFLTTLRQAKNITNYMWGGLSRLFPNFLLGGPAVFTVGKGKFVNSSVNDFHISTGDLPQDILDILNKLESERTQTEINKLDIYSMTSDEFSRFIVYKQLFGRTYLPFHKLWNIDKSLSETGVHSTRASQSPKYSKVSNVEEYFKEFKEAVGQTEVSVVEKQKNVVDNAAMSEPGGIDLDPSKWNLEERLQNPGAEKMLQWTGQIPTTFTPLIISIQPIKNEMEFSALMGFSNTLAANVVR